MGKLDEKTESIIRKYLSEYAGIVDEYLKQEDVLQRFYDFFQNFYKRENLERIEWEDLQLMGRHIHSFNSMALARTKALGKMNQPIEKYREALIYLVYGSDPIHLKVNNIKTANGYALPYFGKSALSELACYAFPDQYLFINGRDIAAAKFLGLDVSYRKGSRAGDKLVAFNEGIAPVFDLYKELVGKRTNTSIPLEVDQFLSWIYSTYVPDDEIEEPEEGDESTARGKKYWLFAPGANADKWDEFYAGGTMAIGWFFVGDLRAYSSKAELTKRFQDYSEDDASHKNDVTACWEFCNEMQPGDIVISKKGRSKYLGYGIIEGDYTYDGTLDDYQHIRKVRWVKRGEWPEADGNIALKTLTDITRYGNYVLGLKEKLGIKTDEYSEPENATAEQQHEYVKVQVTPFSRAEILSEVFIEESRIDSIIAQLRRKKNIVLQGPPGVGKTFVAGRLAYLMMNTRDDNRVEIVQFHQSYSYEDFIQGYRPTASGGFELRDGTFYNFCTRANADPTRDYCFIIDEINRGNLSKIFGELMMLMEHDKRGPEFSIPLTYSRSEDVRFYIPENVYIIGTMNTADRSLAMVDFALRRRFAFIQLQPCFNESFKQHLIQRGVEAQLVARLVDKIENLNNTIQSDKNLGTGFLVGHSYFTAMDHGDVNFESIIENELEPLIREYWFDNDTLAEKVIRELRA